MEWLSQVFTMSWRHNSWASGLRSLRQLSIGVPTGLWFEDRNLSGFHREYFFRSIMLLPGLNAVYFGNMNLKGDWVLAGDESRPPPLSDLSGCSSVQHIYIDQFIDEWDEVDQDYTAESVIEFLLIPKKLKSLTVRGGLKRQLSNDIGNQGLYATMLHLSKSLDNAIEYNCRLRPAEELWGCFGRNNAVRRLYHGNVKVTINAIELLTPVFPWLRAEKLGLQWEHAKTRQNWRTPQFPPNAEVILIQKSYRDDEVMDEQVMEYLENTLWFLVENNARSGGRLKAIYIQQQPNPNKENRIADYEFSKLIKLGREREIDIYVKGNKKPPFYQIDFPTPPTMSMGTGEGTGGEDRKSVFDPFMGRWTN